MALPPTLLVSTLVRLAIAMALVFCLLPRLAFSPWLGLARSDRWVADGARACLLVILVGYLLVAAHIYEWVTLVAIFVGAVLLHDSGRGRRRVRLIVPAAVSLGIGILSELDRLPTIPGRVWCLLRANLCVAVRRLHRPSLYTGAAASLGLVILGVAAWIRLQANWVHATPLYSDFGVVQFWVKRLEEQSVFPDGIYPKGFHLLLASLQKLTFANTDIAVKLFGPLVGIGMTVSVAYAAYRFSGRLAPALVAALVYGTLPALLPYTFPRQAATDSQEFGNLLVPLVLWFVYYSWTRPQHAGYRQTALCLVTLTALIHPLAFANAAVVAATATLAGWIVCGVNLRVLRWYLIRLPLAGLVVLTPLAIGYALGKRVYASSAAFILETERVSAPPVSRVEILAVACLAAVILVYALRRHPRLALGGPLAVALSLLPAVAAEQAPRIGIHSAVLENRAGEFAALLIAIAFGLGWSAMTEALSSVTRPQLVAGVSLTGVALVSGAAWVRLPPHPADYYRLDSDEFVYNFVAITSRFPTTPWLAVSLPDGFDWTLGHGQFLNIEPFLEHYPPADEWPEYRESDGTKRPSSADKLFLFVEKQVHHDARIPGDATRLAAQERSNAALAAWVEQWQSRHGPLPRFFDGQDLTVYTLSKPAEPGGDYNRLFGR